MIINKYVILLFKNLDDNYSYFTLKINEESWDKIKEEGYDLWSDKKNGLITLREMLG